MALACPRCRENLLEAIEVGDVVIDRCVQCAGIWFDNAEICQIVGRLSHVARFESIVPSSECTHADMLCPRCDTVLLRKFSSEQEKGVPRTVYRCVSCIGTWLDRGQLKEFEDPGLLETLKGYFSSLD